MSNLKYSEVLDYLMDYDIISFDVFDTLISRTVIKPVDVFKLVEIKARNSGIIDRDFFSERQKAEQYSYELNGERTNINHIYDILNKDYGYTFEQCNWLINIEIETETEVVTPRSDMLKLFTELKSQGKRLLLCSDMYLSSEVIESLLIKCGYPSELEIWVSNEKAASKHSGQIWTKLFEYLPSDKKIIHIGDNEWSDYRTLQSINKEAILINSGLSAFNKSPLYDYLAKYLDKDICVSLVMGYLINKACFNSPFEKSISNNDVEAIWMGYPLACFMDWILKQKDDSLLLFVTREGYLLKPMYERYCKACCETPQNNTLFYASRAASLAASISSKQDIADTLNFAYEGTLGHYLKSRMNFDLGKISPIYNEQIVLPEQSKKVMRLLKSHLDEIIENGKKQKDAYLNYINSIRSNHSQKMTVIDVGYNGTIQYALTKILNENVNGCYMFLNDKTLQSIIKDNCKSMRVTMDGNCHHILENLLFMEAVMQVPYGQLQKMELEEEKFKPVFNKDGNFSEYISEAQENFCQFTEWIGKWKKTIGKDFIFDFDLSEKIWICLLNFDYISENLLNSFWLADDFAGHPEWRYDKVQHEWVGEYAKAPLVFNIKKEGERTSLKYQIKNIVKKHIPASFYESARKIWVKYIK